MGRVLGEGVNRAEPFLTWEWRPGQAEPPAHLTPGGRRAVRPPCPPSGASLSSSAASSSQLTRRWAAAPLHCGGFHCNVPTSSLRGSVIRVFLYFWGAPWWQHTPSKCLATRPEGMSFDLCPCGCPEGGELGAPRA